MFRCECGTSININNLEQEEIFDCPECGTELELVGTKLTTLHLGPSEE